MSLLVRRELTERARDFNIILDDVSITELSFSQQYSAAVEAKQVRCISKAYFQALKCSMDMPHGFHALK